MNHRQAVKLSKLMSVALRHDPAAFEMELNQDGWVGFETLVRAITDRPGWGWVQADHIRQVVETSDKQRFEIKDTMIRARYGHSRAARPTYPVVTPPTLLYHGTPRHNLAAIRRDGLRAMSRQYVHLSATPEMALQVGQRRDSQPAALLTVRAAEAHAAGVVFGAPALASAPTGHQNDVYLVETVPPEFIDFPA